MVLFKHSAPVIVKCKGSLPMADFVFFLWQSVAQSEGVHNCEEKYLAELSNSQWAYLVTHPLVAK